jgi:hypothetical protein
MLAVLAWASNPEDAQAVKSVLPTSAGSAALSAIAPELRERAFFSARTTNAQYLSKLQELVTRALSPETAGPGEYVDPGTFRLEARSFLDSIGYEPDENKRGGLQDLSSDMRLDLVRETNMRMAQEFGHFEQGQDEAILDMWPAQELIRIEDREEPRDWLRRWHDAGGIVFPGERMVALKNDGIWTSISAFGLPYPPFDFNSGMGTVDVDRDEAMALGLIDRDTRIEPQHRDFNEDLAVSPATRNEALLQALLTSLEGTARLEDGVLVLINSE